MQRLNIPATKTTFGINFDPDVNLLEFIGKSYPSNAMEFFNPLLIWVDKYLSQAGEETISILFKVSYFNTSSSKYLFEILEHFNIYHKENGNVKVIWHYYEDEDDVLDAWKEMAKELDIPYEIIAVENEDQ
jgi:hypothetical protein